MLPGRPQQEPSGSARVAATRSPERWPPPGARTGVGDRIRLTGRLLHASTRPGERTRYPRAVRVLGFLASLSVVGVACAAQGSPDRFVPTNGQIPAIAGTTLEGRAIGPEDIAGKVVLVNFWNPDCPPCRDEMPVLQAAWAELADRGLYVLGVMYVGGGWPNDPAEARAFLDREGITYPTIVDHASTWAGQLAIAGIPTTIVVDGSGMVRYRLLGRVGRGDAERLLAELAPAPSGPGSG
jgi:thiol-disulfide isomerase/thioredoxin